MSTSPMPNMSFLDLTFGRAAVIWWALFWRAILIGGGAGFVIGFIEGFIGALMGIPATTVRYLTLISGVIVGLPIGIYVVQLALRKKYKEFTIRLVPIQTTQTT